MAEINGPNLTLINLFSGTSLCFLFYHTYKFDKCRCLVPRRKEWFRVLLTWMLLVSNMCLSVWAAGWCYVKYQLGWVRLGPYGARPWPSALFPAPYDQFNPPLTVLLGLCYTLQASLNAEEGLYWYHLIRAVRRPQTANPWLGSWYFYAWIGVSVCVAAVQMSVPWVHHTGNLQMQLSKELITGASLELLVLLSASIVVLKFPKFLLDVKASGAGPDVRSRLHFYHEANKVRSFFRFTFTIPLFILGGDGLTEAAPINLNPLASDLLAAILVGSLCIVMMISVMLYLPRSPPSAKQHKVMVGQLPPHHHAQSGFALMSLLREGGQVGPYDYEDSEGVDPFKGEVTADADGRRIANEAPFASARGASPGWKLDKEEKWAEGLTGGHNRSVPHILENFTSPLAVEQEAHIRGPVEIRIQVEREVRAD